MGQLGFFDADKRLQALSARGDPLEAIDRLVPWESFRAEIEAVVLTPDELKKSSAGRKPFDAILMFRMLVLQALNNLSDEQVEYQVHDRLSFSRFLGLAIEDSIPDATTLWLFREKLAKAGLIEKLFDRFDQHLAAKIRAKRFLGHAVIEMVRWIRSARPAASTITPLRTHMVSWLRQ
jgi:IS5 family transposase